MKIPITCKMCQKEFLGRLKRKFCSRTCQYQAQSCGLIKSHSSGCYGFRKDLNLTFRSNLEANFARVCNHLNYKWTYEPFTYKTSLGFYTPDFLVENLYPIPTFIELKGYKKDLPKIHAAIKEHHLNLKILYQKEFEDQYNHLKPLIPYWEDKNNFIKDHIDTNAYETRTCKCSKTFYKLKSKSNKGFYCSVKCANKFRKGTKNKSYVKGITKTPQICNYCKIEYYRNTKGNYCSYNCYHQSLKGNPSRWKKKSITSNLFQIMQMNDWEVLDYLPTTNI